MQPDEDPPPVVDAIEGMRSGSRLKLRWDDFAGAKHFVGLFDKQRDEACAPMQWADGKTYCTPPTEGFTAYSDVRCTMPMGRLPASSCTAPPAQPYFHVERPNADCSRGAPVSLHRGTLSTQGRYYMFFAGVCVYGGTDHGTLYDLGPAIPPSELVELVPEPIAGSGRLALEYGGSSDGARVLLQTRDTELGAACEELMLSHDRRSLRCRPSSGYSLSTYSDATCQKPLQRGAEVRFGLNFLTCAAKPYTLDASPTCSHDVRLLRTGARFFEDVYLGSGACAGPYPHDPGDAYFETMQTVSMAQLTRAPLDTAGARLTPVRFSDGRIRTQTDVFYDAELDTECQPTLLSDGTQRCLPSRTSGGTWTFYTDAGCQESIRLVLHYRSSCMSAPVPSYAVDIHFSGCWRDHAVSSVEERYLGPIYRRSGAQCELLETEAEAYRAGEEVPLERFAPATPVIDP